MKVVLANEGPRLTAEALDRRPLGGVETAVALLGAAFAQRGHDFEAWFEGEPTPLPATADLVVAARVPRLFARLPVGRRVLWLHNPARYLRKPRHLWPLLKARPVLVTLGESHAATLPRFLPGPRQRIPLAVAPPFDEPAPERAPPAPVAIFASNPLRGLDWLLDLWEREILPALPAAELHCYSGAATYGGDTRLAERAAPVLARAAATPGVRLMPPVPRAELRARMLEARAMLYRGDAGETFCLALAEAQAAGLPCVVTDLGAVRERIADGRTGLVARDDAGFAAGALSLLADDARWLAQHRAALARGPGPSWDDVAAGFEALAA
ncbi:MAG: glycosyltransferase [Acetobacteraceae bacterium]|nr:glycosyltransferase [Acetobacteraceae bacterium]